MFYAVDFKANDTVQHFLTLITLTTTINVGNFGKKLVARVAGAIV